jgi:hypothetical protein
MAQAPTRDLMKPEELAQEWQVSVKTLANWRSSRIGPPYVKINGLVRYSRQAAAEWAAQQQPKGAA